MARAEREAFVTGHSGTSLAENSLIAAAPAMLLVVCRLSERWWPSPHWQLLREYLVLVLPLLATLMGPLQPEQLAPVLAVLACLLALAVARRRTTAADAPARPFVPATAIRCAVRHVPLIHCMLLGLTDCSIAVPAGRR